MLYSFVSAPIDLTAFHFQECFKVLNTAGWLPLVLNSHFFFFPINPFKSFAEFIHLEHTKLGAAAQ